MFPPVLSFTAPSQSGVTHQCLSATVQRSATIDAPTVNLSGIGATFYSDSLCSMSITSFSLSVGDPNQIIYVAFAAAGSYTITASATGYVSGSQTDTITASLFTWVGGGGNASWTTPLNWLGHSVPGSGDNAVFDGTCTSNCSANMTADTAVGGIGLYSGYTATVSMNGHNVTNSTNFYIAAGTFSAGTGTLNVFSFVSTGGTFTAGTSTVIVTDGSGVTSFVTPVTFDNLTLGNSNFNGLTLDGTANVTGNLVFNLNGHDVYGTGTVVMTGTGTQTISDLQNGAGGGFDVALTINKSGGSASFTSNINAWQGQFTLTSGTVSASAGVNMIFGGFTLDSGTTFTSTSGTLNVGNTYGSVVTFQSGATFNANGGTVVFADNIPTVTLGSAVTFDNLTFGNSDFSGILFNGTANVTGNFALNLNGHDAGGSGTVVMTGTGTQTISDVLNGTGAGLDIALNVNKTGGSASFTSNINAWQAEFTLTAGTVSASAGLTINFDGFVLDSGTTFTSTTGTLSVGNNGSAITFQSGSTFNANGGTVLISDFGPTVTIGSAVTFNNLTLGDANYNGLTLDGTANVTGNLALNLNDHAAAGTGPVVMTGTGTQTISDVLNGTAAEFDVPLTVNKSGGSAAFASNMNARQSGFTLTAGTVSASPGLSIVFDGFVLDSGTTFTSTTGTFFVGNNGSAVTFQSGSTFNANGGTFVLSDSSSTVTIGSAITFDNLTIGNENYNGLTLNGTANVTGNLALDINDHAAQGTGPVVMTGTGTQTISDVQNGTGGETDVPLTVNKSGGSATITSNINAFQGGFTLTSGTVSASAGLTMYFGGFVLDSGTTFTSTTGTLNVGVNGSAINFLSGSTFNANGGTFTVGNGYNGAPSITLGSPTNFSNVIFSGYSITFTGTMDVSGNLTFSLPDGSTGVTGTGTVVMNGASAQTVTDTNGGTAGFYNTNLTLANTSGGVTFSSAMNLGGTVKTQSGIANMTLSDVLNIGTFTVSAGATFKCHGACGAGTACGQGVNDLRCTSFTNSGTITP